MKKRIVTLSVVIVAFAVGTNSQEIKSPPNLEMCNAQVNLWVAQTDISRPYGPEIRKVMNTLTSKDILDREKLVADCMSADVNELRAGPEGPKRAAKAQKLRIEFDAASTLLRLYTMEQRTRYFNFIARQHLIPKFDEEDQAGER
jgi:hypothetical protein